MHVELTPEYKERLEKSLAEIQYHACQCLEWRKKFIQGYETYKFEYPSEISIDEIRHAIQYIVSSKIEEDFSKNAEAEDCEDWDVISGYAVIETERLEERLHVKFNTKDKYCIAKHINILVTQLNELETSLKLIDERISPAYQFRHSTEIHDYMNIVFNKYIDFLGFAKSKDVWAASFNQ